MMYIFVTLIGVLIVLCGLVIWGLVILFKRRTPASITSINDLAPEEVDKYMEKMIKKMKKVPYSEGWSKEEEDRAIAKGWAYREGSKFVFHGGDEERPEQWTPALEKKIVISKERDTTNEELKKLVEMMIEEKEEKAREERDKELAEYAARKRKEKERVPTGGVMISGLNEDRKVDIKRSDIAVPFGLSEMDKQVLEAFYGDKDLGG